MFNLITILGPTATGKTKLAARLANELNGEIISSDSRQVYKYMNIGTGKDLKDYIVKGQTISYHLIDIAEPTEEYNLYRFTIDFYNAYNKIKEKKKTPFLVGGTGLYVSSIIQNYKLKQADFNSLRREELEELSEPQLRELLLNLKPNPHNITDQTEKERIIKAILIEESNSDALPKNIQPPNSLNIGIKLERDEIRKRITKRLEERLNEGMIKEVKDLLKRGVTFEKLAYFGLEYKYLGLYLEGKLSYNEMFQKLNTAIHRFAKRQMTWFRKMEREGVKINWFEGKDFNIVLSFIKENY
ncbi:tRNA (adenosine(37)-N6)-dimethylallyltransferase MiaA [bacterium BMS3Abin03]|jgi:tRNA dimethylallyltransferase|nr:tRNA (adenosine(37)-N6)-dimethylallyltransferase MiaA [bacterium BMS3Abin03]